MTQAECKLLIVQKVKCSLHPGRGHQQCRLAPAMYTASRTSRHIIHVHCMHTDQAVKMHTTPKHLSHNSSTYLLLHQFASQHCMCSESEMATVKGHVRQLAEQAWTPPDTQVPPACLCRLQDLGSGIPTGREAHLPHMVHLPASSLGQPAGHRLAQEIIPQGRGPGVVGALRPWRGLRGRLALWDPQSRGPGLAENGAGCS